MIPDYDSFEDFSPGFDEQLQSAADEEDFETVDRDVAESFETGIVEDEECDD